MITSEERSDPMEHTKLSSKWEEHPGYHSPGSDWWPNYPEPGTWGNERNCFNCGAPNIHMEYYPGAAYQRKRDPQAGYWEWRCRECEAQGYYYPSPDFERLVSSEP